MSMLHFILFITGFNSPWRSPASCGRCGELAVQPVKHCTRFGFYIVCLTRCFLKIDVLFWSDLYLTLQTFEHWYLIVCRLNKIESNNDLIKKHLVPHQSSILIQLPWSLKAASAHTRLSDCWVWIGWSHSWPQTFRICVSSQRDLINALFIFVLLKGRQKGPRRHIRDDP